MLQINNLLKLNTNPIIIIHSRISHTEKLGLVAYSVIGLSTLNIVYMAAVINYAAQTEMMIDLLNGIKTLVKRSFVDGNRYNNITTAMTVHVFGCFLILPHHFSFVYNYNYAGHHKS